MYTIIRESSDIHGKEKSSFLPLEKNSLVTRKYSPCRWAQKNNTFIAKEFFSHK